MFKISVGIPAFNEEQNIGKLLDSILLQELPENLTLHEIIVSDDSTDSTPIIVQNYASKNGMIRHIHHQTRNGTFFALNEIFKMQESDFLVIIAADSLMHPTTIKNLITPFIDSSDAGLVAGNPVPICNSRNIVTRASKFSASILRQMRIDGRRNILIGRLFAIRRKLLDNLVLPAGTIAEEPYIVEKCINSQMKIKYSDSAICYYAPPQNIRDFVVQNKRSLDGQKNIIKMENLKNQVVRKSTKIDSSLISAFLKCMLCSPIDSACWLVLKIIEKSKSSTYQNISPQWDISYSTKNVDASRTR